MHSLHIPDHTYLSPCQTICLSFFLPNYLSIFQSVYLPLSTHPTTCLNTPYCPSCKIWILFGMLGRLWIQASHFRLPYPNHHRHSPHHQPQRLWIMRSETGVDDKYICWDHLLLGKLEWRSPGPFELASWATVAASSSERCSTYRKVKSTIEFQEAKVQSIQNIKVAQMGLPDTIQREYEQIWSKYFKYLT